MLLQDYPQEHERLKRNSFFYEWITYLILLFGYLLTYLPIGVPVHRLGVNILFALVLLSTVSFYRLWPIEKKTGLIRYTIREKFLIIQLSNHLFGSLAIFFSGGIESPFWFIYIISLIAGAMALPGWALVVAGFESITLYFLTVAFLTPYFYGLYPIGFTPDMLVVPVASIIAIVLTYGVANDLNKEVMENVNLAENLKKKAQEAIGERDQAQAIMTSVSDGIIVLDREKKILFMNKSAEEALDIEASSVLGKSFEEYFSAYDSDNNKISIEDLCPSTELEIDEIVFGPKDVNIVGNARDTWVRLTSSHISEGKNLGIGCIGVFQNISGEKELEEMKLDFVAMAAHELRTPLTAIRGYISVMMEELTPKLNEEEKSFLQKTFISATNLSALIENLLVVSRVERGKLKLDITDLDFGNLIKETVENFKRGSEEKKIKLDLKVEKDLPKVPADKFRISEVISNLLSNAITYSKEGSSVEISTYKSNGRIVTSIEDHGEGIPKQALPKLFTKFFRVSGPLEEGSKGTGLGLYISKAIIDNHGGSIWVESELGKGSNFSFSLPLKQEA